MPANILSILPSCPNPRGLHPVFIRVHTMTFGDPREFAIEAYHEPSGPEWAGFGRMAIDIQGVRIGNIREAHCSLFHAVNRFRQVCSRLEELWFESFVGLSDAEMFTLIDSRYTGMPVDADYSACDFLTNTGEPFDGVKTFIVCRPGGRVQVLYHPIEGVLGSATCSATTFCETAEAFVGWFDDQVRATAPPFFPINPFADKDAGSA